MNSHTKSDIIAHVAEAAGITKAQAETALDAFFSLVTDQAKQGGKLAWAGFGSFAPSQRAARTGRNPRTGEELQIAESVSMRFTPAKALKETLNSNGSSSSSS
jgi:DNA-binding protein HU-beta